MEVYGAHKTMKGMQESLLFSTGDMARRLPDYHVVIGFDAFVDETIRVVDQRISADRFQAIGTISEFSEWAAQCAGRSGSREFVFKQEAGGCSINMGDGLATMGIEVSSFCGMGNNPSSVFNDFREKVKINDSLSMEPGRALVMEFEDGKLMLCAFNHFNELSPALLQHQFMNGRFCKACERADAVVLTSWSVYPKMTACWEYLQAEVFPGLNNSPRFFFDLADPASCPPETLVGMAKALPGFQKFGPVTLSLNGNEANQLARALGDSTVQCEPSAVLRQARLLKKRLGIKEVSIHCVPFAVTAAEDGEFAINGPYCEKPLKSTGAGDRFNAGFLIGMLLGLSPEERLGFACASSGFFVRNGRSGDMSELNTFVKRWNQNELEDEH